MNRPASAPTQPAVSRTLIESFEREFAQLESRTRDLINTVTLADLYQPVAAAGLSATSIGELILKSAGAVEQTCGGLTANLWDDPFEWTLPETLSTPGLIAEYLAEVTQTRDNFFARLQGDQDLTKLIAVPAGGTQPLIQILLDTLIRATGYLERAAVIQTARTQTKPA